LTGQNTFVPGRGSTRYKCAAFVPDISPGTNAPPHLYRMFCTGTNEDYRIGTNAHFSSSGCYRSLVSAVPHSFLEIESLFSLLRFSLMTNDHGCGLELASLSASSIHNVGSSNFPEEWRGFGRIEKSSRLSTTAIWSDASKTRSATLPRLRWHAGSIRRALVFQLAHLRPCSVASIDRYHIHKTPAF
jgi:hypothetical protein